MRIEEMKEVKRNLGLSNQDIAKLSGVPLGTIQKVFAGLTKTPRKYTLQMIEQALQKESAKEYTYGSQSGISAGVLKEKEADYHVQRLYTLEDYLALPDDQRVELIDGVFYDMAAPTTGHQSIGGYIYRLLLNHVLEHKRKCVPFISPVDVQLDCDDKTVVQPDILIVCDRDKFQNGRVFGAPDFLVEVLSPSTRKKDMQLKTYKYANAGVREYWIVDPEKKKVVVYDFEHEEVPVVYTFEDKVPVLIWNKECEIDFAEIYSYMSFLYD